MVTTFLLTEEKRSYIFGRAGWNPGGAGNYDLLLPHWSNNIPCMIYCYLTGVIIFPASSVYVSQFGPVGIFFGFHHQRGAHFHGWFHFRITWAGF